ncbi:MAG: UDP-N-acetylmuramoyl-tripeptide--D-alanyl-D-alanine ligase [Gemmatimonadetes bacterium]|nr:UDP-N-acetylmuramoyl-tripeptide--D-alanyl-D-alanine ligase [Gemmatimonadota bacterium]
MSAGRHREAPLRRARRGARAAGGRLSSSTFVWTDAEVRRALGVAAERSGPLADFTGVATDSRKVRPGELYVALAGERFDGHEFVDAALAAGAGGAIVSRAGVVAHAPLYLVDDTLVALGLLAAHRRRALDIQVVGITGSSGKTSTKDFTRGALGASRRVHATTGNLNNRIGAPMTLLATPAGTDVVVVEMGTNEPGEIHILAEIVRPDVGVITTVGESHLEGLGSVEGVIEEKLDMVRGTSRAGTVVVGDTPPALPERARALHPRTRVAGWTERADADLRPIAVEVDQSGAHKFDWRGARVTLGVPGRHMVQNALVALAVAEALGVDHVAAAAGISAVEPGWMRGQIERAGALTLLLDCYNANPQSTRAALDVLELQRGAGKRVAVLGSMLELGDRSDALHQDVLRYALARDLDLVIATGRFAAAAPVVGAGDGHPVLVVAEDPLAAYPRLRELLEGDEVVLLKASRGVALEALLPRLREDFGGAAAAPDTARPKGEAH